MQAPKDYVEGMENTFDILATAMRVDSAPSMLSRAKNLIAKHSAAFALLAGVVIGLAIASVGVGL